MFLNIRLIDFHKKLFAEYNYNINDYDFYDGSNWYKNNGERPINYYLNFFLLFSCFGILFENFLTLKNSEGDFTKKIVLPNIEKIINLIGVRPLIVPMEPIDTEADKDWYYYDCKTKNIGEFLPAPKMLNLN